MSLLRHSTLQTRCWLRRARALTTQVVKPIPNYARPPPDNEKSLPPLKSKWPPILAITTVGITSWAVFYLYVANQERISSSVFRQIMRALKESPEMKEWLGDALRPEPARFLNGEPWITGAISQLKGDIDISFRIKGSKGSGTLYFTSVRKAKGEPFTILRFRIIGDDGTIRNIDSSPL